MTDREMLKDFLDVVSNLLSQQNDITYLLVLHLKTGLPVWENIESKITQQQVVINRLTEVIQKIK